MKTIILRIAIAAVTAAAGFIALLVIPPTREIVLRSMFDAIDTWGLSACVATSTGVALAAIAALLAVVPHELKATRRRQARAESRVRIADSPHTVAATAG